jgi:hypothetical protein
LSGNIERRRQHGPIFEQLQRGPPFAAASTILFVNIFVRMVLTANEPMAQALACQGELSCSGLRAIAEGIGYP